MNVSEHEKSFDNNPTKYIRKAIFWILGLGILFGTISYGLGWFSEAGQVVKEEFGPKASLEKYEWFKDAASQLEKKKADMVVFQSRIDQIDEDYQGVHRKDWDRVDKQQKSQWISELSGIKASYNQLAAEYNSNSDKFNWSLYETDLPPQFKQFQNK